MDPEPAFEYNTDNDSDVHMELSADEVTHVYATRTHGPLGF